MQHRAGLVFDSEGPSFQLENQRVVVRICCRSRAIIQLSIALALPTQIIREFLQCLNE